jgi:cytidyltransferase-like protein
MEQKKKYKVMLMSGGFDPVHRGHIECIQRGLELADEVWIGLNNEQWLRNKKGKSFMSEDERSYIMKHIKGVTWTYVMNPKDKTDISATDFIEQSRLHWLKMGNDWEKGTFAFGNGGDRVSGGVPPIEEDICNQLGIDLVWGLGDKVQSSSWLLEKFQNGELK